MSPLPLIELRRLTLDYGGDEVVRAIDLVIHPGETKVILGPSGVGKSTILKAILGLLTPTSGQVLIHGKDLEGLTEKEKLALRLRMAMVFQGGALFDSMTVAENVSFRLREHTDQSHGDIEARVMEVLRFVGLQAAVRMRPSQLSGGMKKRVAIARALAPEPEIFLFDEPTVGLDPLNHHNIEQLILKLKKKTGTTLVMVTHDVESACRLADSIVMLHEGKFIFQGSPKELKECSERRVRAFLDPSCMQN